MTYKLVQKGDNLKSTFARKNVCMSDPICNYRVSRMDGVEFKALFWRCFYISEIGF